MTKILESVEIKRPIDKVFAYTTDVKNWPKWQPFPEAEQTSKGAIDSGSTTRGKIHLMGLDMKWTAQVIEYEQDKKFGKNINSGPVIIEQHNSYETTKEGTRFAIEYDMKVGGIMKPFSPIVVSSMRKATKKALNSLKSIVESEA